MNTFLVAGLVGLFGMLFGSYACATVWRLRARQLEEDKQAGYPYDKREYAKLKPLLGRSVRKDRSQCLSCGHELAWYDLLPIVSWVALRGRCRYCRATIGATEFYAEVGMALVFVAAFIWWPHSLVSGYEITRFAVWLMAGVGLAILFIYDAKWFLLPDRVTYPLMVLGGVMVALLVIETPAAAGSIIANAAGAVGAIAGLYGLLYVVSGGRWVGFGDVKLGVVLGLLLADWQLALLTVFAANAFGCLLLLPKVVRGDTKRGMQVPFGPLLIAGWVFASLFGEAVIGWYISTALGMSV